MEIRKTDLEKLRDWAINVGGKHAAIDILTKAGLSRFTANEMLKGNYRKVPRGCTRLALCYVTEMREDELFPIAKNEQAS